MVSGKMASSKKFDEKQTEKRMVKKAVNVIKGKREPKFIDQSLPSTNVSYNTSSTLLDLCLIPPGQSSSQRIGDQVLAKKLEFRMNAYAVRTNTALTDPVNTIRLLIVKYHDDTAAVLPSIATFFDYNSVASVTKSLLSPINYTRKYTEKLFTVLHDSMHQVSQTRGLNFTKTFSLKDMPMYFTPGNTSFAGTNHLLAVVIADDGGIVAPCPAVSYYSRFWYTDA